MTEGGSKRVGHGGRLAIASGGLLVLFCGLGYYLFGQLRNAKLGLVDDHEILRFLGTDHLIRFVDIPRILLTQTEVGDWGNESRFRPVYYTLRILEAMIHGDQAGQWYLTRMVLVVVTAFGFAFLLLRITFVRANGVARNAAAVVLAAVTGLFVLTMPAWTDIAMRLGPSEIYVGVGLMLFAFGAHEIWLAREAWWGWASFFVGYFLAVGSKEDCVLLVVPLIGLLLLRFPYGKRAWIAATVGVCCTLFTGLVAWGVVHGSAVSGGDIYGNTRSVRLFLANLINNPYLFAALLAFVVVLICDSLIARVEPGSSSSTWIARLNRWASVWCRSLALGTIVYVILGEAYFYQNYYTNGSFLYGRYSFVTQLSVILGITLAVAAVFKLRIEHRRVQVATAIAVVVLLLVPPLGGQIQAAFSSFRQTSANLALASNKVFAQILAGEKDIRSHRSAQEVLIVSNPSNYELVYSLSEFLAYYAGSKGVFLDVDIPTSAVEGGPPLPTDPLSIALAGKLTKMEQTGNTADGWRVRPRDEFSSSAYTICFAFGNGPRQIPGCDSIRAVG